MYETRRFSGCAGEQLGLQPRTFQGYFSSQRQDNFYPLLERIHKLYPQVRREWLWWGDGEMLASAVSALQILSKPPVSLASQMALSLQGQELPESDRIGYEARELAYVKQISALQHKIIGLQDENKALLQELDALRKATAQENFGDVPAHGTTN